MLCLTLVPGANGPEFHTYQSNDSARCHSLNKLKGPLIEPATFLLECQY